MKTFITTVAFMVIASANAELSSFYCKEEVRDGRESLNREAVKITETKELKRGNFDHRKEVNVQLIRVVRSNQTVIKEFSAIATAEDVYYEIDASDAQNFKFSTYLDEEYAWVESKDSSGRVYKTTFTCELAE